MKRDEFLTKSEDETLALGAQLALTLQPPAVVLLIGNLGAGKTTLAKGIVEGLGVARREAVSSPTFPLIHEYGDPTRVYHVDLYRLDTLREVAGLGLDEIFDRPAVVLLEWAERFPQILPEDRTEIRLERSSDDDSRRIEVLRIGRELP